MQLFKAVAIAYGNDELQDHCLRHKPGIYQKEYKVPEGYIPSAGTATVGNHGSGQDQGAFEYIYLQSNVASRSPQNSPDQAQRAFQNLGTNNHGNHRAGVERLHFRCRLQNSLKDLNGTATGCSATHESRTVLQLLAIKLWNNLRLH